MRRLSPTDFEQLVFDLLSLVGFRNIVWRTPGADGGRDIECESIFVDPSDHVSVERWYVECKRYSNTLDWPTVARKLAYAANHCADYLLLATTATVSPRCLDEITRHNETARRPRIRVWPGHSLDQLIARHTPLLVKYGMERSRQDVREAMLPLALTISKVCQAAYAAVSVGRDAEPAVEYSAALSELLTARIEVAEHGRPFTARSTSAPVDLYAWCSVEPEVDLVPFDALGLRAALAAVRFVTRVTALQLAHERTGRVRLPGVSKAESVERHLALVSTWSNVAACRDRNSDIILFTK